MHTVIAKSTNTDCHWLINENFPTVRLVLSFQSLLTSNGEKVPVRPPRVHSFTIIYYLMKYNIQF